MDSELQIGLVAFGVAAVVVIVAYNKWQERKHRKRAEEAFRSDHRDVLLEPQEPQLGGAPFDEPRLEPLEGRPAPEPAPRPVREAAMPRPVASLPEQVDPRVDCVVRIESIEPLDIARLWAAQGKELEGIGKPVRWFGFDDGDNIWRPLTAHTAGTCHWVCAALQLVDRRGPLGEADFMRFAGGVQRVADQFLAVTAAMPTRAEALGNATELDRFCASVDVQIGVNIISADQPFAGTKIRGLAEAEGMSLSDEGSFVALDEDGRPLFALANMEPALFTSEGMRTLQTNGLTLVIDVPRVDRGVYAFDRMMQVARHFADALGGTVVDDNRAPFGPDAVAMIRAQIEQFQGRMSGSEIPAGSPLAMRLFAA